MLSMFRLHRTIVHPQMHRLGYLGMPKLSASAKSTSRMVRFFASCFLISSNCSAKSRASSAGSPSGTPA